MIINVKQTTLSALAVVTVLTLGACTTRSHSPTDLPPGEYSRTEQSTNAAGTETSKTTDTNVYYDQYGNKRASQTTTTTRDPEGLLNKETSKSTKTY